MPFKLWTRVGSWNHVLDGSADPHGKEQFWGGAVRCKMDTLPWALQKRLNRSRCRIGATWRIRLKRPDAAKLLWLYLFCFVLDLLRICCTSICTTNPQQIHNKSKQRSRSLAVQIVLKLECGPMPNLMVALPNIGGALCSTPQSLADTHY